MRVKQLFLVVSVLGFLGFSLLYFRAFEPLIATAAEPSNEAPVGLADGNSVPELPAVTELPSGTTEQPSNPTQPSGEASPVPTPAGTEASPSPVPASGEASSTPAEDTAIAALKTQLQKSLKAKKWEEADRQTYELMLLLAGAQSSAQGSFTIGEWQRFSCDKFKEIDKLWSDASEGKLGFSAQMQVFKEVGENSRVYYDKIGWRPLAGDWTVAWQYNADMKRYEYISDKKPNFTSPPRGHLPALLAWSNGVDYRFEKARACNLVQ